MIQAERVHINESFQPLGTELSVLKSGLTYVLANNRRSSTGHKLNVLWNFFYFLSAFTLASWMLVIIGSSSLVSHKGLYQG